MIQRYTKSKSKMFKFATIILLFVILTFVVVGLVFQIRDRDKFKTTNPQSGSTAVVKKREIVPVVSSSSSIPSPEIISEKFYAHGLTRDEPLNIQEVVRSCYQNRRRKDFPKFFEESTNLFRFYAENESDQYFIDLLDKKERVKSVANNFNSKSISLHDFKRLREYKNQKSEDIEIVDQNKYLRTISESRWYGPYYRRLSDCFSFVSAKTDGSQEYFVEIKLDFGKIYPQIQIIVKDRFQTTIGYILTKGWLEEKIENLGLLEWVG